MPHRPFVPALTAALLVVGLAVAVPAAAAPTAAPAAAVANPVVTGTVTGSGGFRAPGVTVSAYTDPATAPVRTTRTAGTGVYTLQNLPPDRLVQICFDPSTAPGNPATGWQSTCYRSPDRAGLFVAAGATVSGIDVQLASGGAIAGTVTADPTTPLGGAVVTATGYGVVVDPATAARATALARAAGVLRPSATTATPAYHASTTTAADGSYRLTGLPAGGDWEVCVDGATATGGSANGYRLTCHGGGTPAAYTPVAVSLGATTTADETAAAGGVLTGRVTGPGGAGVAGAGVTIAAPGGDTVATLVADADGHYRRAGLAGTYTVCATPLATQPAPGLLRQCASGPAGGTAAVAGTVSVAPGSTTTTDLALAPGGDAKLTVTNSAGAPLAGVTVRLTNGPTPARGTSGSDGTLTLAGLAPGVYTACTGDTADPAQKRLSSCFRLLTVRAGQETTVSLVSQAASTLTGLVTAADGAPAAGAAVRVQLLDVRSPVAQDVGAPLVVRTGSDGRWAVNGRTPGSYQVSATPLLVATGSGSSAASVQVVVGTASTTTVPSVALPAGGGIEGQVTRGASPVPGALVVVSGTSVVADATGHYALGGLVPGSASVCAQRVPTTPEVALPTCATTGIPVAGTATADFALRTSGPTVTGRITDDSGDPLPDVEVATDLVTPPVARTDADGRYTLTLLPPGITKLCYDRPAGRGTAAFSVRCETFQAPAGQTVVHDVALAVQAIRGTVTTGGAPVGGVAVTVSATRFSPTVVTAVTAPDGSYATSGLPGDTYKVCAATGPDQLVPFPTGLQTRCATGVAVGATVDLTLPVGAALTGRVVDPNGQPVPGATVRVGAAAVVPTTDGGGFRALGLPVGTPQACADDSEVSTRFAGYLRTCTPTAQLAAGATTTGDVPIQFAGGLSGKVISSDGTGVAGVYVSVVYLQGNGPNLQATRADGTWSVGRLPAGTYTVCFSKSGYGPECWKHRKGTNNRTPITVATGYTIGINGLLIPTAAANR